MRLVPIGLMAAALAAGAAPVASAATFTATITGTVGFGQDPGGVFGLGFSLTGRPFEAVYTTDDAAPGADLIMGPGGSWISGVGAVSSVLTIQGAAPMAFGDTAGRAQAGDRPDRYDLITQSRSQTVDNTFGVPVTVTRTQDLSFFLGSFLDNFTDGDFRTPFTFSPGFFSDGTGFLEISETTTVFGMHIDNPLAVAALNVASFELVAQPPPTPGGVPEPSAWALMILGFGGVGGVLRARRRAFLPVQ